MGLHCVEADAPLKKLINNNNNNNNKYDNDHHLLIGPKFDE